ncbi:MAG: nitric oxide reductase activation protein NorD, partial [Desulfococcaceae bacterium]
MNSNDSKDRAESASNSPAGKPATAAGSPDGLESTSHSPVETSPSAGDSPDRLEPDDHPSAASPQSTADSPDSAESGSHLLTEFPQSAADSASADGPIQTLPGGLRALIERFGLQEATDPLGRLAEADPDMADALGDALAAREFPLSRHRIAAMTATIFAALERDVALGEAVADGLARLARDAAPGRIARYECVVVHEATAGAHVSRLLAAHLVSVFRNGPPGMAERLLRLVELLRSGGDYLLKEPLEAVSGLAEARDWEGAAAFVALLETAFGGSGEASPLPYRQALHLTHLLPRALDKLSPAKRASQLDALRRVLAVDPSLADPFLEAFPAGLDLLRPDGLDAFLDRGLERFRRDPDGGRRFLALQSRSGVEMWRALRVSVSLNEVRSTLTRYLQARTGQALGIRALDELPGGFQPPKIPLNPSLEKGGQGGFFPTEAPLVVSDGKTIYLPAETDRFPDRAENRRLLKALVRLESAFYEFGTFDADLDRLGEALGFCPLPDRPGESDLDAFFQLFPRPALAADLFAILECARLRLRMAGPYPGVIRDAFGMLTRAAAHGGAPTLLDRLHRRLVRNERAGLAPAVRSLAAEAERSLAPPATSETAARFLWHIYPEIAHRIPPGERLHPPLGWRPRPDRFFASHREVERTARTVRDRLAASGVKIYRSDLRRRMAERSGGLLKQDVEEMAKLAVSPNSGEGESAAGSRIDLSGLDLSDILADPDSAPQAQDDANAAAFRYREWDVRLGDYLQDHVRVLEREAPAGNPDFYADVLERRYGLVFRVRRAFEMLRPQGLKILRRWPEGDAFDHPALIDYAVDRRVGRAPSDRLYVKRLKEERDVAVLLLVDLSRSTGNLVPGTAGATVLDVEREAIVLFCEALKTVDDTFAVAGFSGTGRLSVDYWRVKDFDAPVDETVMGRIGSLFPQRSTRTGAALRHATAQLAAVPAKARILLLLGDGFPNDADYKREYAIADTRKAVSEAAARRIHARALTVNIAGDARLDDTYGGLRHNV